jgi:hypothetical protein
MKLREFAFLLCLPVSSRTRGGAKQTHSPIKMESDTTLKHMRAILPKSELLRVSSLPTHDART